MGHYDECREGYCPSCGAAPGNIFGGLCEFCDAQRHEIKKALEDSICPYYSIYICNKCHKTHDGKPNILYSKLFNARWEKND